MSEQSQARQPGERPRGVILRAADGGLFSIPEERLREFRLPDEHARDLQSRLSWRTEVVREDPFLFEPVSAGGEDGGMQMMMPGTGWCACAGKCNCFCGYCSCA